MSIGIILQTMPSLVISHVMLHIIGIMFMPMPIIGIIIGMPPIMGFIPIIMGFIIIGFIPIIGFIAIMFGIMFVIGIPMFGLVIGIAFIMMTASYLPTRSAQYVEPRTRRIPLLARKTIRALVSLVRADGLGAVIADELHGSLPRLRTRTGVVDVRPLIVTEGVFRLVYV